MIKLDSECAIVQAARQSARSSGAPLLLAVSGGLDSIVLLHSMAEAAPARVAVVATFDHGTGAAATSAAAHVAREAARLGFALVSGRVPASSPRPADGQEATWRRQRQSFLGAAAAEAGAVVVTAHHEDDHLETILMRVLRGSGARGLAALAAPGLALRPFLRVRRRELEAFATARGLTWCEDPSNGGRAFLRNRVRHDLLPALRAADPTIEQSLLELAGRAAEWRVEVDEWVARTLCPTRHTDGTLRVAAAELSPLAEGSLAIVWGALAASVGLRLDRRGTRRLAAFTSKRPCDGLVPLSGGWWVVADGVHLHLRRLRDTSPTQPLGTSALRWGEFSFRPLTPDESAQRSEGDGAGVDAWSAALPIGNRLLVRAWGPGDRLLPSAGRPMRRVKRYLSEGGVRGVDRSGWPVVVCEDDVVWIPGVRRSDAATERSGRPVRHFLCERTTR